MRKTGEKPESVRRAAHAEEIPQRLAAIDVGSNTILLLVAEHEPSGGLTVIREAEDQPRLGAGLGSTGRLSEAAIGRALQSTAHMVELAREAGAQRIDAVATAAVREASNGAEFIERARREGIPLRVISPEDEADLAYRSATYRFPHRGSMLVADIGGGSLELIGATEDRIELIDSLPLGAVRLTELGFTPDALREHVRGQLSAVLDRERWRDARLIGSGGTFATLAAIMQARRTGRTDETIQGVRVTSTELHDVLAMLQAMNPNDRKRVVGLRPERADIIVAGLTVADELVRWIGAVDVTMNRYGLREGLLLRMLTDSASGLATPSF
jgi:exopolyphosphatase / guanosine-5'-triphosphate,3'-diphosphate pyrophosphatase